METYLFGIVIYRMPRKGNASAISVARAVNSQSLRASRGQQGIRNANLAAVEPRQVRQVLAADIKQLRAAVVRTADNLTKALKEYNKETRDQRHTACGSRKGKAGLRFLTPGSRDPNSNVLPSCYDDPRGKKRGGKKK